MKWWNVSFIHNSLGAFFISLYVCMLCVCVRAYFHTYVCVCVCVCDMYVLLFLIYH